MTEFSLLDQFFLDQKVAGIHNVNNEEKKITKYTCQNHTHND